MTLEIIFTAGTAVIAYAILANRLFVFTRVTREDALALSEKLVADGRLSEVRRFRILHAARGLASSWQAWTLALMLPVVIFEDVVTRLRRGDARADMSDLSGELREDYERFVRLSIVSTLATSPLALALFGLTIALASFAQSGARLADAALLKVMRRDRDGEDMCPPRQPA